MTNVTHFQSRQAMNAGRLEQVTQSDGIAAVQEDRIVPDAHKERTFHFWRGASNRRYVHIVHNLLDCPELPATNYILVSVEAGGQRTPLRIARTASVHGSENLATIRQHAARLGASEVHLHLLSDDAHAQSVTQWDLQAANFATLVSEGAVDQVRKTIGA